MDWESVGISTHAPLAGRDTVRRINDRKIEISTHAPLAGRDLAGFLRSLPVIISTHAPLAGRDERSADTMTNLAEFQPTRPLRGATDMIPGDL